MKVIIHDAQWLHNSLVLTQHRHQHTQDSIGHLPLQASLSGAEQCCAVAHALHPLSVNVLLTWHNDIRPRSQRDLPLETAGTKKCQNMLIKFRCCDRRRPSYVRITVTGQWSAVIPEMTYKKLLKSTVSGKSSKFRFDILKQSSFH